MFQVFWQVEFTLTRKLFDIVDYYRNVWNKSARILGFDRPSKVIVINSSNRTEWPGWSGPMIQINVVQNWLGSDSILWDKFIHIGSDIADPQ